VHAGLDDAFLRQVVWNLLANAIKFTASGGRVEVRSERADGQAQITVTDTGEGVAAEFPPFIFAGSGPTREQKLRASTCSSRSRWIPRS
jgi:signal transduction histidine kinase